MLRSRLALNDGNDRARCRPASHLHRRGQQPNLSRLGTLVEEEIRRGCYVLYPCKDFRRAVPVCGSRGDRGQAALCREWAEVRCRGIRQSMSPYELRLTRRKVTRLCAREQLPRLGTWVGLAGSNSLPRARALAVPRARRTAELSRLGTLTLGLPETRCAAPLSRPALSQVGTPRREILPAVASRAQSLPVAMMSWRCSDWEAATVPSWDICAPARLTSVVPAARSHPLSHV